MPEDPDNPRSKRELQQRFDYEVRNKGVDVAIQGVRDRNAARQESQRRAADLSMRDHIENNVSKELERKRRNTTYH